MKNCGPKGYPGMAEVGNMGLPPKLLRQGVKDMVRISDARMSGTAYGTVVLHVAPEAADGGPLAVVRDGDWIELDSAQGRLHLDISDAELQGRLAALQRVAAPVRCGGYSACMSITCCRPTRAATSTSWSAAAAMKCRGIRIRYLHSSGGRRSTSSSVAADRHARECQWDQARRNCNPMYRRSAGARMSLAERALMHFPYIRSATCSPRISRTATGARE